jgi:hypothetical protein
MGSGICYRYHLVEYTVLGLFTARRATKTVPLALVRTLAT